MRYKFSIEIHPGVNFHTKAAEVYVCDDSEKRQIIVQQKHIQTCATTEEAEKVAEEWCANMHRLLSETCKSYCKSLKNAEP